MNLSLYLEDKDKNYYVIEICQFTRMNLGVS